MISTECDIRQKLFLRKNIKMQKNVTKQKKNTLNILLRYGVQFLSVEL